ncbi:hypothetical protein D8674_018250 [Pyrus ussuriensis x Pyrus communis]|uniref:Uncharacterized protein n=1 Tax=Pyrus ussuriensis x Pyrus communis TaxID=2448454 RepID=A0A5N5G4Q4_9ROSA|nr:hypothetical protein D8674_018250 [Pyrus ussuriensis x Pyrus communis]
MVAWRLGRCSEFLGFWRAGEEEARRHPDTLRHASVASASPAKHFAYSNKTEAFASSPSLKGALVVGSIVNGPDGLLSRLSFIGSGEDPVPTNTIPAYTR